MPSLKGIIQSAFSILSCQVANIHAKNNRRLLFPLIFLLVFPFYFARELAFILCAYFRLSAYFELDLVYGKKYQNTEYLQFQIINFIICLFSSVFDVRLFGLLFFTPSALVWSHLYDLVVRNREQASLQWWQVPHSYNNNGINGNSWWISKLKHFRPNLSLLSRLQLYPHLEQSLRLKCLRIYATFEVVTTITLQYLAYRYYFKGSIFCSDCSTLQKSLYYHASKVNSTLYHCGYYAMYFLVELATYLLCTVYSAQYRALNGQLKKVINTPVHSLAHSPVQLSRATAAYRTGHTGLTTFILHFNDSTISKIIAYYIHYHVPFHTFKSVQYYAQRRQYSPGELLHQTFVMSFYALLLLVITFFTARVNAQITASAPTLGSLLARRGVQEARGRRRKKAKCLQVEGSTWQREILKLSTYYELVWRTEKMLAFTAGPGNTVLDWKFLSEVCRCLIVVFKLN